jgi:hypothetical protein
VPLVQVSVTPLARLSTDSPLVAVPGTGNFPLAGSPSGVAAAANEADAPSASAISATAKSCALRFMPSPLVDERRKSQRTY